MKGRNTAANAFQLVHQAGSGIKYENLAIRRNGNLLITDVANPKVYELDLDGAVPGLPSTVYTFPNATGVTGIIETTPDIFVVVAGIWNSNTWLSTYGSFAIWSIDYSEEKTTILGPKVSLIAELSECYALNGIIKLPWNPTTVLIADSVKGVIWRMDTVSGAYGISIENQLFTNTTLFPIGINGIPAYDNDMYFINSAQRTYGRVPLNQDGSAAGKIQILQRAPADVEAYDDLNMDWKGSIWVATHPDVVSEISLQGTTQSYTASGNGAELAQPTSIRLGRSDKGHLLYVTCAGNGSKGGQIWVVDTCALSGICDGGVTV